MERWCFCYQGHLCVKGVGYLRQQMFIEAHSSWDSIHPGSTMIYLDIWETYWWNGMKKDIVDFIVKCPNCLQAKVVQQRLEGMTRHINISV